MKYAICEVESRFIEYLDRSMCRVARVLQVCNSKDEAEQLEEIFNPMRYGDYDTIIRIVSIDKLDSEFR